MSDAPRARGVISRRADASRGRARARRDAMVLGVSTTTLVLAIGAGALALGPRDVPVAAKFLGRLTGRAVAHVGGVARAIERATNERELRGIRAEVRASMKDLRGVAREIERELTPSGRRGEDEGEGERERGTSATATTATVEGRFGDVDVGEIRAGDSGERARGRGDAGERRVRRRRFRSARGEF